MREKLIYNNYKNVYIEEVVNLTLNRRFFIQFYSVMLQQKSTINKNLKSQTRSKVQHPYLSEQRK